MMNESEIGEIARSYGRKCSFEKLVKANTREHNGLRYQDVIPWTSMEDQWVKFSTRVTGSTLEVLHESKVRNFEFTDELVPDSSAATP